MKKSILLLAVIAGSFAAQAQEENDVVPHSEFVNLKAAQGDLTTEFALTGGLNNADFKLNEGTSELLRFRYFLNNNLALRLGFGLSLDNQKQNVYGVGIDEGKSGFVKTSANSLLINLGLEKHFKGTGRLAPYVGGDILFGISGQKTTLEDAMDANTYVSDVKIEAKGPGTFGIGLRGVIGADYYIAKHVYLGAEAGFGFLYSKEGKTKVTTTIGNATTTTNFDSAGNEFTLSPSVITGIRIGFVF
jgi:outer membrane protein W